VSSTVMQSDRHVCGSNDICYAWSCPNYEAITAAVCRGNLEEVKELVRKVVPCRFEHTDDRCQYALVMSGVLRSSVVARWALSQDETDINGYVYYGVGRKACKGSLLVACMRESTYGSRGTSQRPAAGGVDCNWYDMMSWVVQQEGVEVEMMEMMHLIEGVLCPQLHGELDRFGKMLLLSHAPPSAYLEGHMLSDNWREQFLFAATMREMFNEWRQRMREQLRAFIMPIMFGDSTLYSLVLPYLDLRAVVFLDLYDPVTWRVPRRRGRERTHKRYR
jgi:hypothetical protein